MDTETNEQKCHSDEPPPRFEFDSLPQELVVDIASRLPITSLVQFKFVRKSFYNLSHDPELVNLHLSRAVNNIPCVILHLFNLVYFIEFSDHGSEEAVVRKLRAPFANSVLQFEVVGSCHGLLCIRDVFRNSLYVYNPFTRDCKELPISIDFQAKALVFGFGFHPITKEYKVIKITYYPSLYHDDPWLFPICTSDVQVFTLGGSSWRSIGEAGYQINPYSSQGCVLNGKMHWLTRLGSYYGRHDSLIVSFDLGDEVFGEVPKVDFNVDPRIVGFYLAVLGGCLAVTLTLPRQDSRGIEIWVMKEYSVKESWVKEFIIGAYTPTSSFATQDVVKVLCQLKNGEVLLDYGCGSLISYDPQKGVFRTLKFQGIPILFQAVVHVGGLNWNDIPSEGL